MKKLSSILFCALLLSFTNADAGYFDRDIKVGTYDLRGSNTKAGYTDYTGSVVITRQGDNYKLVWHIDGFQTLTGIGVVEGDVLSVAYCDIETGNWGVISFKIDIFSEELDGRWASSTSTGCAYERLTWRSYYTY